MSPAPSCRSTGNERNRVDGMAEGPEQQDSHASAKSAASRHNHTTRGTSREQRRVKPMASRGRKPGFIMSDEHRVKIQNSNILNALIEHVNGQRDMSSSQVTAGIALMRKVLPDLQSTEITADVVATVVSSKPLTAEEWAAQHASAD
jgi:hypothetical protein